MTPNASTILKTSVCKHQQARSTEGIRNEPRAVYHRFHSGREMIGVDRYNDALNRIPAPGDGCHTSLLSVANIGMLAGISPEKLFDDMRQAIPEGSRRISDREITDAIHKALADHNGGTFTPRSRAAPVVHDGKTALQRIISQGKYWDVADLWEASPIRLLDAP